MCRYWKLCNRQPHRNACSSTHIGHCQQHRDWPSSEESRLLRLFSQQRAASFRHRDGEISPSTSEPGIKATPRRETSQFPGTRAGARSLQLHRKVLTQMSCGIYEWWNNLQLSWQCHQQVLHLNSDLGGLSPYAQWFKRFSSFHLLL